ncbi:hypothetical protein ACEYW6_21375 [Nostoc sp. UIC 10607]|uniref:hypothetical protein n=1 Tax=Nostoc sp. UIC 10607 TaxID=3045935 RepID=UPI0039A0769E
MPQSPIQKEPIVTWEALPADFILPDDPVENIQQPAIAAALTDALGSTGRIQPQMLIGSNLLLGSSEQAQQERQRAEQESQLLNKNANALIY